MEVSKLEARFGARNEAGQLGRHVKRTEAWKTWDMENLRSPPPHLHCVVHRAGEEKEGLSLAVQSL